MGHYFNEKGMTLVEMLAALALASVILSGLMGVYWIGSKTYETQTANSDVQYAARMALQKIADDIRGAVEAKTLEGGTELSLVTSTGETVVYYRGENNWLYRSEKTNTPIAENVIGLRFTRSESLYTVVIDAGVNGNLYSLKTSASRRCNYIEGSL